MHMVSWLTLLFIKTMQFSAFRKEHLSCAAALLNVNNNLPTAPLLGKLIPASHRRIYTSEKTHLNSETNIHKKNETKNVNTDRRWNW